MSADYAGRRRSNQRAWWSFPTGKSRTSAWAWDDLRANADPGIPTWRRSTEAGSGRGELLIVRRIRRRHHRLPDFIREHPIGPHLDIPHVEEGLRGLEQTRKADYSTWMHRRGLDAVIFPTVADVGPADMDVNPASADLGWRNGVWVANGNLVPRHLGIPTVTVPMGMMADIGMPVGLTFAGHAYDDTMLLTHAAAFEATDPSTRSATAHTAPDHGHEHSDAGRICAAGTDLDGLSQRGLLAGDTDGPATRRARPGRRWPMPSPSSEPVTIVVDPNGTRGRRPLPLERHRDHRGALNDAWMRDIGPTFVHTADGSVAAVDWVFNGWGAQDWAQWDRDAKIGRIVAEAAGVPVIASELVNEGGGIQVDGEGTVLLTDTVQLDPGRNPDITRAEVEAELARTVGTTHAVWLPCGLTRDSERFGTRGHVDIVAAITSPGRLLLHTQRNESHPDFQVSRIIREAVEASHDAAGREWEIIEMPRRQR